MPHDAISGICSVVEVSPADIDGDTVTEGNDITHALRHIMVIVVTGLHRLYSGIAKSKV